MTFAKNFTLPEPPWRQIAAPLSRLDDALGGLSESLRRSPVATGLAVRLDLAECCALALDAGQLIEAADLALHDAGADARAPTHELVTAHRLYLTGRRRAAQGDPADHLARTGLRRLAGLPGPGRGGLVETDAQPLVAAARAEVAALLALADDLTGAPGEADDETLVLRPDTAIAFENDELLILQSDEEDAAAMARLQALRRDVDAWPPALAALALAEAWRVLAPLPRHDWLGPLAAALQLKGQGRCPALLLPVALGARLLRKQGRGRFDSVWTRGLAGLQAAVTETRARHDRLLNARERLLKRAATRRRPAHLLAACTMVLDTGLITAPGLAERCGISGQAALNILADLAPVLTELSGRQRYRVWTVG